MVDVTDTTVLPANYGDYRRVLHKSTIDTTVVYTRVVYVTDTTAERWRHTPTKLLPLTSPNPNPNPNTNPNPNPNPNKSD